MEISMHTYNDCQHSDYDSMVGNNNEAYAPNLHDDVISNRPSTDENNSINLTSRGEYHNVSSKESMESCTNIRISLLEADLWECFHKIVNEMIVTRDGRRMFPVLKFKVSGLEPNDMYKFELDFQLVDNHRWKYINGDWRKSSRFEVAPTSRIYTHPDSPNYGRFWMESYVSFSRTKITNREDNEESRIFLNSMFKYLPRIYIKKIDNDQKTDVLVKKFSFQETEFIAVTAYQNDAVTSLKVKYNPFAKAFLEPRIRDSNQQMTYRDESNSLPFNYDGFPQYSSLRNEKECITDISQQVYYGTPYHELMRPCFRTDIPILDLSIPMSLGGGNNLGYKNNFGSSYPFTNYFNLPPMNHVSRAYSLMMNQQISSHDGLGRITIPVLSPSSEGRGHSFENYPEKTIEENIPKKRIPSSPKTCSLSLLAAIASQQPISPQDVGDVNNGDSV